MQWHDACHCDQSLLINSCGGWWPGSVPPKLPAISIPHNWEAGWRICLAACRHCTQQMKARESAWFIYLIHNLCLQCNNYVSDCGPNENEFHCEEGKQPKKPPSQCFFYVVYVVGWQSNWRFWICSEGNFTSANFDSLMRAENLIFYQEFLFYKIIFKLITCVPNLKVKRFTKKNY